MGLFQTVTGESGLVLTKWPAAVKTREAARSDQQGAVTAP